MLSSKQEESWAGLWISFCSEHGGPSFSCAMTSSIAFAKTGEKRMPSTFVLGAIFRSVPFGSVFPHSALSGTACPSVRGLKQSL
jgi:hypothetical protein